MKTPIIIAAAVVGVLLVVAGSFWGGMSFGQSRAVGLGARVPRERLAQRREQFAAPGQTPGAREAGGQRFAGGVMGTIETVGDDTLVITTQDDTFQVQITDTTLIDKFAVVAVADL